MRALVQRVTQASVTVEGQVAGSIGPGLLVFLGVGQGDTEEDAAYLAEKVANLRIFADAEGRFNLSALEVKGEALLVSQFTLYAETRKGRRPSFTGAAPPQEAEALFQRTVAMFQERGLQVETGRFQAHMRVSLVNDGPVTIMIDSAERRTPRKG
ncbi:MAG: D-tyrosyl-tRNA(Tyr) deacylase [Chloroflexi bacterium]|nr:D-tyrosyl-tRNA(Tyr) deacylase [Chloroflexota bacterium]